MKFEESIQILKTAVQAVNDPKLMANKPIKNFSSNFVNKPRLNIMESNIFVEPEDSDIEFNEDDFMDEFDSNEERESVEDNSSNEDKKLSLESQGVLDSITSELTSVRLQQAIILSEIVGKPRSKTRKRRRF